MTSPLITATGKEPLSEAARRMSAMHVRRLPVVKGDLLVGVLTENDVLRISPSLIELTREWSLVNRGRDGPGEGTADIHRLLRELRPVLH